MRQLKFLSVFLSLILMALVAAPSVFAGASKKIDAPGADISVAVTVAPAPDAAQAYTVWEDGWRPFIKALSSQSGVPLSMRWSAGQLDIMDGINAQRYPIVIGPVTTIAQAIKSGYKPLAATTGQQGAVLVTLSSSPIKSMSEVTAASAKHLRLGMLRAPAVAEFGGRALLQKSGVAIGDFKHVHIFTANGAAMLSLVLGETDIAALGRLEYEKLARPGGLPLPGSFRVLASTQENGPGVGLAVLPDGVSTSESGLLLNALENPGPTLSAAMSALHLTGFHPATDADYAPMTRLAFTVPHTLPGAGLVTATQVRTALESHSAILIDARSESEYAAGHIPGAVSVPYAEISAQALGFDASKDTFDFGALYPNHASTYIFSCNGIECWKSYKAATWALRHGYQHVLWFRGGFPAWKMAGFPVATGQAVGVSP